MESTSKEPKVKEPKAPVTPTVAEGIIIHRLQVIHPTTVEGDTQTSLYSHKGYSMVWRQDGVYIEYKNTRYIIPLANVIAAYVTNNPTKR